MPRITEERREQQRRRIVEAAVAVIVRRGMAGFSMGEVIAESGLSAGAIYGYFAGKDELVLAVGQNVLGARTRQLVDAAAQRPVPAPLHVMADFLGTLPAELIQSGAVLQLWGEAGQREQLRGNALRILGDIESAMRTYLETWFTGGEGREPAAARELAARAAPVLLALTQGYVVQSTLRGPVDVAAYLEGVGALAATFGRD